MKGRFSLNNLLNNNRFVIVFALLLAITSWIAVAMTTSQTRTRFIEDVPINLDIQAGRLQALDLSFIGAELEFVTVEVTGTPTAVGLLSADNFTLSVNVAQIFEPGEHEVRIEYEWHTPGEYDIVSFNPSTITVRVDQISNRFFEVQQEITGLASAEGYMTDTPRLIPESTVRVTGPRRELERVYSVSARMELDEALDRPLVQDVPLILLDMAGNVIDPVHSHLSLDFEVLTVQIPVLRVRTLPLVIDFQNVPIGFPQNVLRSYMMLSAETVTIAGPISAMENYEEWRLGFINLRNITEESNIFAFDIILPSDQFINIDNLQTVVAEFDTDYWDSATFNIPGEDIALLNRPVGYEVTLQSVSLSGITFVGALDAIANLTVGDIVVEVNLNDRELTMGPQPFPVRISVPNQGMVWPVEENNNLTVYINVTDIS